jgi:multiple sugar transport system substrate-binding protein
VIDHPGLGQSVRDGALRPLDELLSAAELAACAEVSAGRSYASYQFDGHQWALPIDAAAQVSVCRANRAGRGGPGCPLDERPASWADARRAARVHPTAICLGGPHALLMFSAICVALGAPPASADTDTDTAFADPDAGAEAAGIMADLLEQADATLAGRNPIAVLDAMAADDGPVYCPLVYGYVTYQRPRPGARALTAFDAPAGPGGIGSVLGGTGLAVTRSCADLPAAREQLLRLVSRDVQVGLYAELGGQSADRRAWSDASADESAGGFYSATRATIEAAWVRPRFAGYVEFQAAASAGLRDGLLRGEKPRVLAGRVNELFVNGRRAAAGDSAPG